MVLQYKAENFLWIISNLDEAINRNGIQAADVDSRLHHTRTIHKILGLLIVERKTMQ
jgi:hypothetical protein